MAQLIDLGPGVLDVVAVGPHQTTFEVQFSARVDPDGPREPVDVSGFTFAAEVDGVAATVTVTDAPTGRVRVRPPVRVLGAGRTVERVRWWMSWSTPGGETREVLAGQWTWRAP